MDSKYKKEVVNETRADIWRRHVNQFSIGMLIAVAVLFLLQIASERSDEFYAQTQFEESLRPIVVEDTSSENSARVDAPPNTPQSENIEPVTTAVTPSPQSMNPTTASSLMASSTPNPTDMAAPESETVSETSADNQTSTTPTTASATVSPVGNQTYYVIISANLRPCPYVTNDCAVTESLNKGTPITVTSEVNGEVFRGSTLWYSLERDGQTMYVHSLLVSTTPPAP